MLHKPNLMDNNVKSKLSNGFLSNSKKSMKILIIFKNNTALIEQNLGINETKNEKSKQYIFQTDLSLCMDSIKYIKLLIYCEKINCGSIQIYNHGNSFIRKDGEILSDDENFILYGCIRFSDEYGVLHNNLYAHIVKNIRFYVKKDIFKNFTFSDKKFKICLVKLKINSIILLKNKIALFYKNNQKKFYGIPKVGKDNSTIFVSFHCLYINNELSLLDQAIIKITLHNNYSRYIETNFNGSSENMKLEMRFISNFNEQTDKICRYLYFHKSKRITGYPNEIHEINSRTEPEKEMQNTAIPELYETDAQNIICKKGYFGKNCQFAEIDKCETKICREGKCLRCYGEFKTDCKSVECKILQTYRIRTKISLENINIINTRSYIDECNISCLHGQCYKLQGTEICVCEINWSGDICNISVNYLKSLYTFIFSSILVIIVLGAIYSIYRYCKRKNRSTITMSVEAKYLSLKIATQELNTKKEIDGQWDYLKRITFSNQNDNPTY